MIAYVVIIGITTLLIFLSEKIEQKSARRIVSFLAILFPAIMAGIRYGIGTDYLNVYEPFFLKVANSEEFFIESRFEFGYELINVFVAKILNLGFPVVMFICSFITIFFVYMGIKQYKDKINVVVAMTVFMLLYYQMSFNIVRQLMSVSIIFYALSQLNKSKIKYILLVLFATLFQKTSIIMLIVPIIAPIYTNPKYKKVGIAALITLIIVILNYKLIYSWLINVEFLRYYVASYLRTTEANFGIGIIVRSIPFIIPAFFLNKENKENKDFLLMFYVFIIGCILRILAYVTTTYAERIALYFTITQVFLVGYYVKNIVKYKKIISISLIAYTVFLWYYDFFIQNMNQTVPYTTIFQLIG